MESNSKILQGIDTVIVRVSDIEQSKAWYQDKLGLEPVWEDAENRLVVLDTSGPTSITLLQTTQTILVNKETAAYPIFKSHDAEQARRELQLKGVSVDELHTDKFVKFFSLQDTDGNYMEVCQVL